MEHVENKLKQDTCLYLKIQWLIHRSRLCREDLESIVAAEKSPVSDWAKKELDKRKGRSK